MLTDEQINALPTLHVKFEAPCIHDKRRMYIVGVSANRHGGNSLEAVRAVPKSEYEVSGQQSLAEAASSAIWEMLNNAEFLSEAECSCGKKYRLTPNGIEFV